jgi:hypothetical protein
MDTIKNYAILILVLILISIPLVALLYWIRWIVDSYQSKNKLQFRLSLGSLTILTIGPLTLFLLIENFEKFEWLTSSRAILVWLMLFALAGLIPLYFATVSIIKRFRRGTKWPVYLIYGFISLIILFSEALRNLGENEIIVWLSVLTTLLIWPYFEFFTWVKNLYKKGTNKVYLILLITPSVLFAIEMIKAFIYHIEK